MGRAAKLKLAPKTELKLDLGCGPHPREGFIGVDIRQFDSQGKIHEGPKAYGGVVTVVTDLRKRWPWKDSSVSEAHCSHFLEHLTAQERIHFVNELHRVLVPGGKAQIITPHWASCRAYGDLTHQWPPVSEFWFYYLNKDWREQNAPHNDFYTCDFDFSQGHSMHPEIIPRNAEYQTYALRWFKEAAQDTIANLTKK